MSEDQRSTRSKKVLVVANPDSGDSDNANESHRRPQPAPVRPTHAYTHPPHRAYNPYPRPSPSVVPPSLYRQQISPEQYYAQDVQHHHSSSAPPTEHPAFSEPASRSPPAVDYPQQQAFSINVAPLTLRKGNKLLPTVRAPLGSRPKESSSTQNGVRRLAARSSPSASAFQQDTLPSTPQPASSPQTREKIILVTTGADRFVAVDVSNATSGLEIQDLVLASCMRSLFPFPSVDPSRNHTVAFYQTEIGFQSRGEALSLETLFAICRDQSDSKGSLKFFVSLTPPAQASDSPPPAQPSHHEPSPPLRGPLANIGPLRPKRRSRSRNNSVSSSNGEFALDVSGYEGYEADLDNEFNGASKSRPQLSSSLPHPPSPRRRPSLHYQRPSSPLVHSPESAYPSTSPHTQDRIQRKEEKPRLPIAPPLSPNRPTYPLNDDSTSSLSIPRQAHARNGSDATADRDIGFRLGDSTDKLTRQRAVRDPPSSSRLRTDTTRDAPPRPSRLVQEDDDDWEVVAKGIPSSGLPSSSNEQATSRAAKNRAFRIGSKPALSPSDRRAPAQTPLNGLVFATWKAEPSKRNGVSLLPTNPKIRVNTKSMDNLKLASPGSASSSRRLPFNGSAAPTTSPNISSLSASHRNMSVPGPSTHYDPRSGFGRPMAPHLNSSDYGSASSNSSTHRLPYGSVVSPSMDPYPRPNSATGDPHMSPTRYNSNRLQSPVYGSTLELNEPRSTTRAVSPHRPYHHSSGIPGPRPPRPNYSDRSDRSSDIQSGQENSTPPRTPISPSSPRDVTDKHVSPDIQSASPVSPDNPMGPSAAHRADSTIRQDEKMQFTKFLKDLDDGTVLSSSTGNSTGKESNAGTYVPGDDYSDDEDGGNGTWVVRPEPPRRPELKVQIAGSTSAASASTHSLHASTNSRADSSRSIPQGAPQIIEPTLPRTNSTFDSDTDSWAPRPPPENIYDRLDNFFSKQILDKAVFDGTTGDASPTESAVTSQPAPPPKDTVVEAHLGRVRATKKSIRIVAQEHKNRIDRTSRGADPAAYASQMMRKRSTKLWGSRVEEVTTSAYVASRGIPESPGQPTTFKWVRGELLGKGTYGRVYLALNATTGEMIAVKQVELPQTASDKNDSRQHTVVQALKSESETLKDLDHPHIVQYLGFEETPTNLSIFLEYVPGGSVGSCLRQHGKFQDNVTRSFTGQILSGLEYLHSKGILHRDMKADNILVEMSGTCKISDFGISKRTDDMHGGAFTAMQGTVFWMAPEVINTQKKGYNFKIDIWSVGCVVLEMWAGNRPWTGEEMVAVMFKLYQAKLPPPVPDDVVLSPEADDFRMKCFAINPDERPSSAELRKHPYLVLPPGWVFSGFT